MENKNRFFYLDLVKVVAIYLVLFAHSHTYGTKLYVLAQGQKIYPFYLWLDCIRTINNPLFFMASGALLLKPEKSNDIEDMRKQIKKIGKYLAVLIIFSFVQYEYKVSAGEFEMIGIVNFFKYIYTTPIHFSYWFIYAYLGYLIMMPFSRKIACNISRTQFKYLITVMMLFMYILPVFQSLMGWGGVNISLYINTYTYSVYPIVGSYLHNNMNEVVFDKKWKIYVMAGLAMAGSFVAAGFTHFEMVRYGEYTENYITYFNLLTAMTVFCLCYKFGNLLKKNKVICKLISTISSCVFGIYLLENIIENIFSYRIYEVIWDNYPRLIICVIYMTLTVVAGTIVTWLIKRIPVVGKLL